VVTRRQMFFETNSPIDLVHEDVHFTNVPGDADSAYGIALQGRVWDLLDEIVAKIPVDLRPAVTVDLNQLDIWELMEQAYEREHGHRLPEEYVYSPGESELIRVLGGEPDPRIRELTPEEWQLYVRGEWPVKEK
jgi:hypothetical protein